MPKTPMHARIPNIVELVREAARDVVSEAYAAAYRLTEVADEKDWGGAGQQRQGRMAFGLGATREGMETSPRNPKAEQKRERHARETRS